MTAQLARRAPATRLALGALVAALMATAAPALAQTASAPDAEARLRRVEAEVRALQRQVFPGSDGKFFAPEVVPSRTAAVPAGTPASSPVTDLLTRMEAVESQLARLTAQNEETANRVAQIEARLAAAPAPASALGPVAAPGAEAAAAGAATGLAAAPAPVPAPVSAAVPVPAAAPAATPATPALTAPAPAPVVVPVAASKPAAVARPVAAKPSAQRIAAVQKVEKPQTGKPADDEYTYGFRLWDAKFYPEAAQQLRLYVDKYPRDAKISYGRNLLGRALLDDGKPREAAPWFLQNYQADRTGARAADSLLNLAEAMRQLKDTSRACIALAEFGETYAREAAGRLKPQYDATRAAVKCD